LPFVFADSDLLTNCLHFAFRIISIAICKEVPENVIVIVQAGIQIVKDLEECRTKVCSTVVVFLKHLKELVCACSILIQNIVQLAVPAYTHCITKFVDDKLLLALVDEIGSDSFDELFCTIYSIFPGLPLHGT